VLRVGLQIDAGAGARAGAGGTRAHPRHALPGSATRAADTAMRCATQQVNAGPVAQRAANRAARRADLSAGAIVADLTARTGDTAGSTMSVTQ
jgi:hypothetical protein